ncbi:STY0301 family protein [Cronobacter sakazakii]
MTHRLNDSSLFQGPPEKQGELMPDNDNRMVWTLKEYQSYGKKMGLPLWLVCRYENTSKTVELKVPDSANQCKARSRENSTRFYAFCE